MSDVGSFFRGDEIAIQHTITAAAGGAQDLTGLKLICTGKLQKSDLDSAAVFQLDYGGSRGGITVATPETGVAISKVPPAKTAGLTARTLIYWDLELIDGSSQPKTVDSGSFWVEMDVTIAVT